MTPEDKEWFREYLGEGMHTAFRKAGTSDKAQQVHRLITMMSGEEWSSIVDFVADAMIDGLEYRAKKAAKYL